MSSPRCRRRAIGTGRLLPDGHIGRMAVLADWRGKGVGRALLERLLEEARLQSCALALHAQTHASGFYRRFGFVEEGPEFMEAGIPHRTMVRAG
jgi:predicted GNAT family N-acyltransferase